MWTRRRSFRHSSCAGKSSPPPPLTPSEKTRGARFVCSAQSKNEEGGQSSQPNLFSGSNYLPHLLGINQRSRPCSSSCTLPTASLLLSATTDGNPPWFRWGEASVVLGGDGPPLHSFQEKGGGRGRHVASVFRSLWRYASPRAWKVLQGTYTNNVAKNLQ